MRRERDQAVARQALEVERAEIVSRMLAKARENDWSQRELARRAGLAWTAWHRLANGKSEPLVWVPKARAAARRLQA